jgi:hypothetical protein
MPKRVLIASSNTWSFCLAAERAVARASGAQVDVLNLFKLCSAVSPHWRRRDVLIEQVSRKFERFVRPLAGGQDITPAIRPDKDVVPPPQEDVSALRRYRRGPAYVGLGVLSSVMSRTTVQMAVSSDEYGPDYPAAWLSAHLSAQIGEVVADLGYDEVHIFNGRACYSRPFCDLVEQKTRLIRYEQGAAGNSYIQADRPIHHPRTTAELILAHDFSAEDGTAFYVDRLRKVPGDTVHFFTAAQVQGNMPTGLVPGEFIAFFTSSSDEMVAISDDVGFGDFATQFDAAFAMAAAARMQGKRLVVRMHPHLRYKHESWQREWDFKRLTNEGAVLIWPGDPCDSYSLAEAAHCVFTCGSTVGLECSFRGIPNADVGNWVGARLGAMQKVLNPCDVACFIERPFLPDGAVHAALLYGSFIRRAGIPLPEYDVGSHPNYARIAGQVVDPLRYGYQLAKDAILSGTPRSEPWGLVNGKAVVESNLEPRAREEAADIRRRQLEG